MGGADLFFELCQFFFQEIEPFYVGRDIGFGIQSSFILVECLAPLGDIGFQRSLRMTRFYPLLCCFYLCPEEGKVAGWPELDLKRLWELGLYLLEDAFYFASVIDQGTDWSR